MLVHFIPLVFVVAWGCWAKWHLVTQGWRGQQCRLQRALTFPSSRRKAADLTRREQTWEPRAETSTATICKSVTSLTPGTAAMPLPRGGGTGGHTELSPRVWGHAWSPTAQALREQASSKRPPRPSPPCEGPCPAWEQPWAGTQLLSLCPRVPVRGTMVCCSCPAACGDGGLEQIPPGHFWRRARRAGAPSPSDLRGMGYRSCSWGATLPRASPKKVSINKCWLWPAPCGVHEEAQGCSELLAGKSGASCPSCPSLVPQSQAMVSALSRILGKPGTAVQEAQNVGTDWSSSKQLLCVLNGVWATALLIHYMRWIHFASTEINLFSFPKPVHVSVPNAILRSHG